MTRREMLIRVLLDLESTVHVGSPRAMSVRVAHAEVPDAVEAVLVALGLDGDEEEGTPMTPDSPTEK